MSTRRKQRIPKHLDPLALLEQPENGSAGLLDKELSLLNQNNSGHLSDDGTAISELSYKTNEAEDTSQDAHVCGKCRREFLELNEFLLHKRACTGIGPPPQEDSKSGDGELPPTHVTLEALRGTRVAVAQFNTQSSNDAPATPALQDALVSLRQQQAVQLQLFQQLEAYVRNNVGGHTLGASLERPDSPKVQPADTTNQEELDDERAIEDARAATSESEAEDRSKSPKIKSDQGQGGPLNALCAPLPPDAAPEVTPNQPNTLELLQKHTEKALQNTMSGGSFLLNGLGAFPDEANGDGKRGEGKDNYFRHRCRFCGKVFGSDSALQIHIRSHTGERPFKCNVCGNRFSTKGNLKVHFQRHKAKYPHVKMNPHPVPEHLDKHFPPLEPPGERVSPPPGQLPLGPLPLLSTAGNAPLPLDENARFRLSLGLASPHTAAKSLLGGGAGGGGDLRLASAATADLRLRPFPSTDRSVENATNNPLAENVLLPGNSVSAPGLWQLAKEFQKSRERVFGLAESARSNHDEEEESNTSDRSHDNANREQNLSASPAPVPAPSSSLKDPMNAQEPRSKRLPLADEEEKLERMDPAEKRRRNEQDMSSDSAPVQGQSVSDKSEMSECDDTGITGIIAQSPDGDAPAGYESWEELMEVATDTESGIQKLVELSAQNGGEPNQCVICQRVLSCRSALQMHYRTHTGERPFRCKLCGRAFTTKGNLKTHMGVHRVKAPLRVMHQCPLCSKQFTNSLVLQQHVRSHNNNTDSTNSTTGQPQDLSCTSSPNQGLSPRATPSPQRQSPPVTPNSRASLENPNELFPSRSPGASELNMSVNNDEGSRSSPDIRPEVTFREGEPDLLEPNSLGRLNSSPLSHPGVVPPEALANFIPDLTASRRKATIEALRRNSLNPSEKTDASDGHETRAENGRENGFSKSPLAMPLLLSGGTSLAALESLTNGAQGLGGIALGLMDGRISAGSNNNAAASDRRRSSPKQDPVLDLSSKPLSKLNTTNPTDAAALAVTNLLQTIHNQVKPPTQAELLAQGKLLPGLRFPVASPNGRPNTTCQICYKTFACNSALEIHYRSHTKERPFKCAICERGFSTKGNLKQHMLTHKIRDLPPQLFTQTNTSPGAMNPNAKLGTAAPQALQVPLLPTSPNSGAGENSSDSSRGTSPSTQSPLGSTSSTPTSRHVCTYCQRPFSSSSSLQIHLRTHTGDKPFRCGVCSRAFTTKGNLKVHMGTHVWNQQQSQQLALLAPNNQATPPKNDSKRGKKLDPMDLNQVMAASRPDLYFNPYLNASFLNAAAASGGLPLLGGHEPDSPLSLVNKGGLPSEAMSSPLSLVKHLQQMQYPLVNHLHIGASLDSDGSLRREISASPESGLSSKFEPDPEALSLVKKAGSRMQDINDNNERQKEQILSVAEVKMEVDDQLSSAEVAQ